MNNGKMSEDEWRVYHYNEVVNDLSEIVEKIHALAEVMLKSSIAKIYPTTMQNYWDIIREEAHAARLLCVELSVEHIDNKPETMETLAVNKMNNIC